MGLFDAGGVQHTSPRNQRAARPSLAAEVPCAKKLYRSLTSSVEATAAGALNT